MSWLHDALFKPTTAPEKIFVMIFAIVLFVVVMGAILWLVDRSRVPRWLLVLGFVGPVVGFLAIGLLWPAVVTVYQSLRSFDAFGTDIGWAGLDNYHAVFTKQNVPMLINSVLWVFLVPVFATVFGLIYAALVDRVRGEAFAKALIFLPVAISMVAASIIWKYVYYAPAPQGQPQVGLLNALVELVGGTTQNWVTKFPTGTFALIIVMVWIQTGLAMTLLSAAIKAVPDEIVEAAHIDGAGGLRLFWSITIPSIRPTLIVVITTIAIASLKTFDIVNVMGGNLPINQILANAFYSALSSQQNGLAGAYAVIIFVIVTPVIVFNVRQMKKSEATR